MDDNKPDDLKEIEEQAKPLIRQKEYAKALSLYEEAEARGLSSPKLYAGHASALAGLKRWPEAAALIDEQLKEYPSEPSLYTAKAFLSLKQKKPRDALAVCDYAASIGVWDDSLAESKSECLIRLKEYREAASFITQELEKYPDDARLHLNLWRLLVLFRKRQQSKQEYQTAMALDPSLVEYIEKKRRKVMWFTVGLCIYFIIGILLLPGSRYYLIPFWLFCVALGMWLLPRFVKQKLLEQALLLVVLIFLGVSLGFYSTFNAGHFGAPKDLWLTYYIVVFPEIFLGLLVWFVMRRRRMTQQRNLQSQTSIERPGEIAGD